MTLTMSAPLAHGVDMVFYYSEIKRKRKGLIVAAKVTLNSTSSLKVSVNSKTDDENFCGMYCLVCETKT